MLNILINYMLIYFTDNYTMYLAFLYVNIFYRKLYSGNARRI